MSDNLVDDGVPDVVGQCSQGRLQPFACRSPFGPCTLVADGRLNQHLSPTVAGEREVRADTWMVTWID